MLISVDSRIIKVSFLFILNCSAIVVLGQKKMLDFTTQNNWPIIESASISNDGKYVKYQVHLPTEGRNVFIRATDLSWSKELQGAFEGSFTGDGQRLIFSKHGDSLGIWQLGTENLTSIAHVKNFILPEKGDGRFMVYQKTDSSQTIVLLDLITGQQTQYTDVRSFRFDKKGRFLVIAVKSANEKNAEDDVRLLDLTLSKSTTLCRLCRPSQFTFDDDGAGIAFFTKTGSGDQAMASIRYYKEGMDSASVVADNESKGLQGMVIRDYSLFFPRMENRRIFFFIGEQQQDAERIIPPANGNADVNILGGNDVRLDDELFRFQNRYLATIDFQEIQRGVTRLQLGPEKARDAKFDDIGEWIAMESNIVGDQNHEKRSVAARPDIYLTSTVTGFRKLLKKRLVSFYMQFSPSGKYLIWFDRQLKHWFSYNIGLNRIRNISAGIKRPVYLEDDRPDFAYVKDIAGWRESGTDVLIYDRHDIWQVDLDGAKAPVNLTHQYGFRNNIRFECLGSSEYGRPVFGATDTVILSAFNLTSKQDGFFRLFMKTGKLEKLVMNSCIYTYKHGNFCGARSPGNLMKAKNADTYIVPRMSTDEYPNWYVTNDFKHFNALTNLSPQKEYNWYTSELIHWKLPNGKIGEGILFKPQNFDPQKKYPVIFHYYEKGADDLNIFLHPELSYGAINIPWFVSNGYLVFVPDIHYDTGYPGKSACNTVTSAALYLAKKPWVNAKKMGLQGHSFGGEETNYIVSHSHLFAAAAPSAGMCDDISYYNESEGSHLYFEMSQGDIGASLWRRPDLYIENSPVLKADKVSAAMLIMHGKLDHHVPYAQGLQWYHALNLLGKKVWMLTYQEEGHTLDKAVDQLDYSIRLGQFFDYFLKDTPIPKWMIKGIPHSSD